MNLIFERQIDNLFIVHTDDTVSIQSLQKIEELAGVESVSNEGKHYSFYVVHGKLFDQEELQEHITHILCNQ